MPNRIRTNSNAEKRLSESLEPILASDSDMPVAFDLGGVLLRGGLLTANDEVVVFDELSTSFGIGSEDALRVWKELQPLSEVGKIPESFVWESIAALRKGVNADDVRSLLLSEVCPIHEGVNALTFLKSKSRVVMLATNQFISWTEEWRRRYGWFQYFDHVVCSEAIGSRKPAPEFFREVFSAAGERPCWFIDDRPENALAAGRCGLRPIWAASPINWVYL